MRRARFLVILPLLGLLGGPALGVDGDVTFPREGRTEGDTPLAVFPHWLHRIRYRCYACHPSLFLMKAGTAKVTMETIAKGEFCGACHNGEIASAVTMENCSHCHPGP